MKKYLLFIFIFFLSAAEIYAQSSSKENLEKIKKEIAGTYQIQILGHSREPLNISEDIYEIIKSKRDSDRIVFHQVSQKVRIKILPYKAIESKNFTPLPEQSIVRTFE